MYIYGYIGESLRFCSLTPPHYPASTVAEACSIVTTLLSYPNLLTLNFIQTVLNTVYSYKIL